MAHDGRHVGLGRVGVRDVLRTEHHEHRAVLGEGERHLRAAVGRGLRLGRAAAVAGDWVPQLADLPGHAERDAAASSAAGRGYEIDVRAVVRAAVDDFVEVSLEVGRRQVGPDNRFRRRVDERGVGVPERELLVVE